MSIGLKVGEVDPPSIVADIVNLPDPVRLGGTITAYNYDAVGLYFRIDCYNAAWTGTSVDLGLIGAGSSLQQNLDQFASRARPAVQTAETLIFRLRAYTDAGYTTLKWTYLKTLDVLFIKSDDGSWTLDVVNNFDDGTVQGWTGTNDTGAGAYTFGVATDYVLSPPYSLKSEVDLFGSAGSLSCRQHISKAIGGIPRSTIFAIIDIRIGATGGTQNRTKWLETRQNGVVLSRLGKDYDVVAADYFPKAKWMRIIVALPINTALTLSIYFWAFVNKIAGDHTYDTIWIDDFKVISK